MSEDVVLLKRGRTGERGQRGRDGRKGESGIMGPQGDIGENGKDGAGGAKGNKGVNGEGGRSLQGGSMFLSGTGEYTVPCGVCEVRITMKGGGGGGGGGGGSYNVQAGNRLGGGEVVAGQEN